MRSENFSFKDIYFKCSGYQKNLMIYKNEKKKFNSALSIFHKQFNEGTEKMG